ncbi:MAG: cytochrome P450 [Chloroflexi bacterium]|nr:cytochrome P450 [Chloroflexota bacterium]
MTTATADTTTKNLYLTEDLILMLLNEESGFFYQVPGWALNCTVAGAAVAQLSLMNRVDSDTESLFLLDDTKTGDPVLDPILAEIAGEDERHNVQYWIERLAPRAESIIDSRLERLVEHGILLHHAGEFWTLAPNMGQLDEYMSSRDGSVVDFVRTRISRVIYENELPDPRDMIIISLVNACGVMGYIFELDEEARKRVEFISNLDEIGRSIGNAVTQSVAAPLLQRPPLTKPVPKAPLRDLLFNKHMREGNLPALFADLAAKHGPVFEMTPPFQKERTIYLASPETNQWAHKHGRMHFRAKEYFQRLEEIYGVSRSIHSMDGADHFRYRKAMQPSYSRESLTNRIAEVQRNARTHLATWKVDDKLKASSDLRVLMNTQISPLLISTETQDIINDVIDYKVRALNVGLLKVLPNFMLHTPTVRRKAKMVTELIERIQRTHTPAQRLGKPQDVADGYLGLNASDPQFLPESDLNVPLGTMLMASMYLGDQLGLAMYALVSHPDLYARVTAEADALFANGEIDGEDIRPQNIDVTHRVLMETLRMYPIVAMAMKHIMNTCVVEGFELPVGARVVVASTASHYMKDVFPEPLRFDIDRYLPPRNEHLSTGYAPYGLGTHACMGFRWSEVQLALNMLMMVHYFKLEFATKPPKRIINSFPSQSPSNKIVFRIAEQRHELHI